MSSSLCNTCLHSICLVQLGQVSSLFSQSWPVIKLCPPTLISPLTVRRKITIHWLASPGVILHLRCVSKRDFLSRKQHLRWLPPAPQIIHYLTLWDYLSQIMWERNLVMPLLMVRCACWCGSGLKASLPELRGVTEGDNVETRVRIISTSCHVWR